MRILGKILVVAGLLIVGVGLGAGLDRNSGRKAVAKKAGGA